MCGIAGIMTTDGRAPDQAALDALQDALRHRGPDGVGQHLGEGVGVGTGGGARARARVWQETVGCLAESGTPIGRNSTKLVDVSRWK